MSEKVKNLMDGPWTSSQCGLRISKLQADLEAFQRGGAIEMCMEAFVAEDSFMGRLNPSADKVWDIRSRDPRPGLRLFGHFADPDIFVAFDWSPRSHDWNGKQALGDRYSELWNISKASCIEQWGLLFPNHEALDGVEVHEFVTKNAFSH